MRNFSRRQFLSLSGLGLSILVTTPATSKILYHTTPLEINLPGILDTIISDRQTALHLGQLYRDYFIDDGGIHRLATNLQSHIQKGLQAPGESISHYLHTQYSKDFSSQDTVLIDNWLLPRTEARLFALLTS